MNDAHRDDELDRRLRELARTARERAESVGQDDVDRALAEVRRGRRPTPTDVVGERGGLRRGILWLGIAATVIGMLVGFAAIRRGGGDAVSSVPPVTTATGDTAGSLTTSGGDTVPDEPGSPASSTPDSRPIATTSTTPSSSSTTSTTTTTTTTTAPTTTSTVPGRPATAGEVAALLDGVAWESSGIAHACDDVEPGDAPGVVCTRVLIGPGGVPISFDPRRGVMTVHAREDGAYRTVTMPDELHGVAVDPLAVGPDDVVYLVVPPDGEASDVYVVSIAAADAGHVLARYPAAIPIGDIDVFPSPGGLVASGWYAEGPRPAADADVLVEWVDRDTSDATPSGVEWAWFDDVAGTAGVGDRAWTLGERLVASQQGGSSQVVPTFDGGFIAAYLEPVGELRAEILRGRPDGSVEHWLLPAPWNEIGAPVLEPMGTFLLPSADVFVRVAPFADRTPDLGGLDIDLETGVVDVEQLNSRLDGLGDDSPAVLGPVALADAIAGRLVSPAELRTIVSGPANESGTQVVVTTERFLDDSVYGTRFEMVFEAGESPVRSIVWSQTCQPDRGQQDYRAALCV